MIAMLLLLFIFLQYAWEGSSSSCIANSHINKLDLVLPAPGSLVQNPYYTKLSAEVSGDLAAFRAIQDEFHLCAHVTADSGDGYVEVFRECGRSVFGQGAVPAAVEGENRLTVTLFHNSTQLCEVRVTVQCCINQETVAVLEQTRKEAVLTDFLHIGQQLVDQVAQLGVLPDTSRTPAARLASLLENQPQPSRNVLVGIKSSALNLVKRNSIRATWLRDTEQESTANQGTVFYPFFLMGLSPMTSQNASIKQILDVEHAFYQDILSTELSPATDTYWTLGEKVLSFADWARRHIPSRVVDYVVICDDDVFVDVWQLQRHLAALRAEQRQSYYAGEVLEVRMHDTFKPIRDPQHRNFLPVESYPLPTLPPFALGNFYILSGRLWDYIARNADALKPVGTLEDLSVGVWMLGLQVFPTHLSGVCDITRCLYDASLFAEAEMSSADAAAAPAPRLLAVADLQLRADFDLLHRMTAYRLQHALGNSQAALNLTRSTVAYIGARLSQPAVSNPVSSEATVSVDAASAPGADRVGYELPQNTCRMNLVLGKQAQYAQRVVDELVRTAFSACYVERRFTIDVAALEAGTPAVFPIDSPLATEEETSRSGLEPGETRVLLVLSVLDCSALDRAEVDPLLQLRWTERSDSLLRSASTAARASATVLLSGEPMNLRELPTDALDLLLTTTNDAALSPAHIPTIYLPVLATAFYEMSGSAPRYSPLELLKASIDRDHMAVSDARPHRSGVAYLYHRCDRPAREAFFSLLQSRLPAGAVEPLGRCSGIGSSTKKAAHIAIPSSDARQRRDSRFETNYMGEAIELYRSFRFVIAFENSRIDGYMTEKLLTAYLAGAVPVYLGAPDVATYFNPASMINCADFADLEACAERVAEVYANETEYVRMRAQAPITDDVAWTRLFSMEKEAGKSAAGRETAMTLKTSLLKVLR